MTKSTDQIEIEVAEARPEVTYIFKNRAVEGWEYEELKGLSEYIKARIIKEDKGLAKSFVEAHGNNRHAVIKEHGNAFALIQKHLNDFEDVGLFDEDDKRQAADKLMTVLGKPFYKRYLNALRVKKSSTYKQGVIKTTGTAKYAVEDGVKSAKELGINLPKGELVELLLNLGAEALSVAVRDGLPNGEDYEKDSSIESYIGSHMAFYIKRALEKSE